MRLKFLAVPILALSLTGCAGLASVVASAATGLSSETPSQVATLAEADLAADVVVRLAKAAVDTNRLDAGELTEIQALRAGVRSALDALHAANAKGQSLNFAIFNAALKAYRSYASEEGFGS